MLGQRALDFGERRRGAGGQHQFARRVIPDTREARQIERVRRLHGAAERTLRAAADHLDRFLGGQRLGDRIAQFAQIGRYERYHAQELTL